MRFHLVARGLVLTLALSGLACGGGGGAPSAGAASGGEAGVSAAARKEAQDIFALRCTPCHGPQGHGDGPASAGLTPPPRNFGDPTWQDSVTDEHVEKIIQYGGAAVGKSPAMPPNPDLTSKPEVVRALREHVRSLRAK
jgi:mono/diheme cytochrome c family protein